MYQSFIAFCDIRLRIQKENIRLNLFQSGANVFKWHYDLQQNFVISFNLNGVGSLSLGK